MLRISDTEAHLINPMLLALVVDEVVIYIYKAVQPVSIEARSRTLYNGQPLFLGGLQLTE